MTNIPYCQPRLLAFFGKTDTSAGEYACWLWMGAKTKGGYGAFRGDGGVQHAHRWSYQFFVGPIPEELEIDHLCRVRHCVNPRHLEAVTGEVNRQRGDINQNATKTHCPKGHPYDATQGTSHWRRCRRCSNEYKRKWRLRKKLEALDAR